MTQETEELAPSVMAASDRIKKTSKAPTKPLPDQNLDLANIQGVGILDSQVITRRNPLQPFQENPYFDANATIASAAPMNPVFEQTQAKSTIENSLDSTLEKSFDLYVNASVSGRKADKLGAYVRA